MVKVLKALCAALLLAMPGVAMSQSVPLALKQALPEVDRIFADFHVASHSPGLVYGIVADGRLVHVKSFGVQDLTARRPVTSGSLFRIASMTKAFTALAILRLRDEGRLSLDAPAETFVPELRSWRYPTADSPRITIRHLLTHTAGFVTDNPWGDRQQPLPEADFTAMLRQGVAFSRPPGTAMEYSNFGYALLGRIVANVSGRPYRTYVEQTLLKPLGMTSTGFEVSEAPVERRALGYRWEAGKWTLEPEMAHGAFAPMGGLQTSPSDYARYVAWLLLAWPPRDGPEVGPVRRASIRELAEGSNFIQLQKRPGKTGDTACQLAGAYGKGMNVVVDCDLGLTLGHSGGYPGYGSYMLLLPEHNVGIFALSNRTYQAPVAQVWDAAVALHNAGAWNDRTLPVSALLAEAYKAAGIIYQAGDVAAAGDKLAMNFLMDRSAEAWRRELAGLKRWGGQCGTDDPITPSSAMSGTFVWTCTRGSIRGELLLSPSPRPSIQKLVLKHELPWQVVALAALAAGLILLILVSFLRRESGGRKKAPHSRLAVHDDAPGAGSPGTRRRYR